MEADPPLIVDADAVLTASIAVKLLQPVPREGQVTEAGGRIKLLQPPQGLFSKTSECLRRTQVLK